MSLLAPVAPDQGAYVAALPRRVAHAMHALLAASSAYGAGQGPHTAAEVCVYDSHEAYSPRHTGQALRQAQARGLCVNAGGYWFPTNLAYEHRRAFEERYIADEDLL